MTTSEAVNHLSCELKKDYGYWYAWQSNIAVAFMDELSSRGYKLPDQHEIANEAAIRFLKNLTYGRETQNDPT